MNAHKMTAAMLLAAAALCGLSACETEPKTTEAKATLTTDTSATLARFKNTDSTLQGLLDKSVGYAVFPEVSKAGFIAGGSYGRGELFEKGKKIGYVDITQGTIGLQIGAQTFSQLVIFLKQSDLDKVKANNFEFAANASAVAMTAGAAGTADYAKGVIVYVIAKGGLMAEAAIGGQHFSYKPM